MLRLMLAGGLSAMLAAGQSCPNWSASFNRITDQSILSVLRANQQAGWKAQIDASGGAQAALQIGQSALATLNQRLSNDQVEISSISVPGSSVPPGPADCSGQNALSAARCDYYQTQQQIFALQGTLQITQCYAGQGAASSYGQMSLGQLRMPRMGPAATGVAAALGALGSLLNSRANSAAESQSSSTQETQQQRSSPTIAPLSSAAAQDLMASARSDLVSDVFNKIAADDPTPAGATSQVNQNTPGGNGNAGTAPSTDAGQPPPVTSSQDPATPTNTTGGADTTSLGQPASDAGENGPWTDPLSAEAVSNSQTPAPTVEDAATLQRSVADLMKKGISESGEVGESSVTLVDNLDNWGKFYSSDPSSQISGTAGIAKNFNSEFNSNPLSKAISDPVIGVVGSFAQQENKILSDIDQASAADLNSDIDAVPSGVGGALFPGVQNLQQGLQNAGQTLQNKYQSFKNFFSGRKNCSTSLDPDCLR